jgi:hypothetical protein
MNAVSYPTDYQSASPLNVIKCTGKFNYYSLGALAGKTSIQKQFTGLSTNHFQISVIYGYALVATTSTWTAQPITLNLIDGAGTITPDIQTPACTLDSLFGCSWSWGCYPNFAKTLVSHTTDSLTLNFSLPTALAAGQAWGIRDITIILDLCHSSCGTCTAYTTSCLTCATGLYFSGSICVSTCPFYTQPDIAQCVLSCPTFYFLNTVNNFCEPCPAGCSICTASDQCITWDSGAPNSDLFMTYIATWIILTIFGLIIIGLLIWRFCISKKSFYNSMEEEVIDHKPAPEEHKVPQIHQSHEAMDTHWIEDIDDLHMTKVVKKKLPKDMIEGIGNPKRKL